MLQCQDLRLGPPSRKPFSICPEVACLQSRRCEVREQNSVDEFMRYLTVVASVLRSRLVSSVPATLPATLRIAEIDLGSKSPISGQRKSRSVGLYILVLPIGDGRASGVCPACVFVCAKLARRCEDQ